MIFSQTLAENSHYRIEMANSNGSLMKSVAGVEAIAISSGNQKSTSKVVPSESTKSPVTEGLKDHTEENNQLLGEKEFQENRKEGLDPRQGEPSQKNTLNTSSRDAFLDRLQKSDAQMTLLKLEPSVPARINGSVTSAKQMENKGNVAPNLLLPGTNPLKKKKLSEKVDKYILGCITKDKCEKMETSSYLDKSGNKKMETDLTNHLPNNKTSDTVSKTSNLKPSRSTLTNGPQIISSEQELNDKIKTLNSELLTPVSKTTSRRTSPTILPNRNSARRYSNPLPATGISNGVFEESNRNSNGVVEESNRNSNGVVEESNRNSNGVVEKSNINRRSSKRSSENSTDESSNSSFPNSYTKKLRGFKDKTQGKNLNGTQNEMEVSANYTERVQRKKRKPLKLREENILRNDRSEQSSKEGSLSPSGMESDQLLTTTSDELRKGIDSENNLRKIKRKDLENLVIELFVNKVLYEHELGRQKELCKRLEATLEANRAKAARFHKEIEDFKKVTQRLEAEHSFRKNLLVAPMKVKRSVGIQANPTIIGKGLMHAESSGNIRVLSASSKSLSPNSESDHFNSEPPAVAADPPKPLNNVDIQTTPSDSIPTQQSTPDMTVKSTQTKVIQFVTPSPQPMTVSTSAPSSGRTQMLVVNSIRVNPCPEVTAASVHGGTTRLVRTPLTPISTLTTTSGKSLSNHLPNTLSCSRIIDLTSEVEVSKNSRTPTTSGNSANDIQQNTKVDPPTNNLRQLLALKSSPSNKVVWVSSGNIQKTSSSVGGTITDNSKPLSSALISEVKLICTKNPGLQPRTVAKNPVVQTTVAKEHGVQPRTVAKNPVVQTTVAKEHGVQPRTVAKNPVVQTTVAKEHGVQPRTVAKNPVVQTTVAKEHGVQPRTVAKNPVVQTTVAKEHGVQPRTVAKNPVVQTTVAKEHGVQPATVAKNPRVQPMASALTNSVRPTTSAVINGVRSMNSANPGVLTLTTAANHGVRPKTSAHNHVRQITSASDNGIPQMTSVSNHGVQPMTSAPNHRVPQMTSVPNYGVRPMTSVPNHGIPQMTSAPNHGVPQMTPNYGVRPMTSTPNHGVPQMTSAPNHGVRVHPMTSVANHGVRPMTSTNHGVPQMTSAPNNVVRLMTSTPNYGVSSMTSPDHGIPPMTSTSNHGVLPLTPVSNPEARSAIPPPLNSVPTTVPPTVFTTSVPRNASDKSFVSMEMRHPAPFPKVPSQQTIGCARLPSSPVLKLSHEKSSIVLSWNMAQAIDQEPVSSFQLFAYQEGKMKPSPSIWKKVGSVKALELPMACTLTQFMPGFVYHFAVRAIDSRSRIGPFSKPKSIRLEK